MLADRRYCYPLTITDFASRYLLCCDALGTTQETYAFTVFERALKDFGLPLSSDSISASSSAYLVIRSPTRQITLPRSESHGGPRHGFKGTTRGAHGKIDIRLVTLGGAGNRLCSDAPSSVEQATQGR